MNRAALRRSFDVYYRDTARTLRMDRLNAQFVCQGGLAFDIGAHVGDRTASFRRLGAPVVAVEPQPRVFRALRLIHGRDAGVNLRSHAVGQRAGEIELHINSRNPTVSTVSRDLIVASSSAARWQDQKWDSTIRVPVTTLDHLIEEHGVPDFVKIDVEGHEFDVLKGLTRPVKALSFEFTTLQRTVASACLDHLATLGSWDFNVSFGEEHNLRHDTWLSGADMKAHLADYPDAVNSGDIYARHI